jgi:hypothetical protein
LRRSEWDLGNLSLEIEDIKDEFPPEYFGLEENESGEDDFKNEEWDFSDLEVNFVMTIKAPIEMQAEIRKALKKFELNEKVDIDIVSF